MTRSSRKKAICLGAVQQMRNVQRAEEKLPRIAWNSNIYTANIQSEL